MSQDPRPTILLADDQPDVLEALTLLLKLEGMRAVAVTSPAAVLERAESEELDAAIIDLNYTRDTTSGHEGMNLLARLGEVDPSLPVVVMTAWGSIAGAVEAMRRGARDYVEKPWDNGRLVATLRAQVELGRALRRSQRLEQETSRQRERQLPAMVAESRAMLAVLRLLERVAPSDANVLVTGEHGTGKEVAARWIHAASERASRPFVAVNAGGLADGVFESELFGHVRGAFTDAKSDRVGCFELADGGTLFLDELGTMPHPQQAKLLRVLQTGEFHPVGSSRVRRCDVRVVSATNVELAREVTGGKFREDLLYRLNTVEVRLPPLRERREDIPVLASAFLRRERERRGRAGLSFSAGAMQMLLEHRWPGNVRELEHAVERAVLLARGGEIGAEDLLLRPRGAEGAFTAQPDVQTLEDAEKQCILRALGHARGSVVDAARSLGVSRSALYRRLQHYGIKAPGSPGDAAMKRSYDRSVLLAAAMGPIPAAVVAVVLLFTYEVPARVRYPLAAVVVLAWVASAATVRRLFVRPLETLANVLAAYREGDFSVRVRAAPSDDTLGAVAREANALGDALRVQRLGALEATALLAKVMTEIDVAIFAFDEGEVLRLANPAGERLLGHAGGASIGARADAIGLAPLLRGDTPRTAEATLPGGIGPWEVRRRVFREGGRERTLLVLTDLKRALREEERKGWQRLVRVLGHEINNSLAPIHSIAANLLALLGRTPEARPSDWEEDLARGLAVVGRRADSLGRFMGSYTRLAKLPPPRKGAVDVGAWVRRVAQLEPRLPVRIAPGPEASVVADGDQLEQLLINLVRNAADAALEAAGSVEVGWAVSGDTLDVVVRDEGPGLGSTDNLFVLFFTTKPGGTGVGLVLSRQIAEAHGGTLSLVDRADRTGCEARLRLPLGAAPESVA